MNWATLLATCLRQTTTATKSLRDFKTHGLRMMWWICLHGLWKEVASFHGPHTRAVAQKALVPKRLDFCPRTPKQSVFVSVFGLTWCGSGWSRRQRSMGRSKVVDTNNDRNENVCWMLAQDRDFVLALLKRLLEGAREVLAGPRQLQ